MKIWFHPYQLKSKKSLNALSKAKDRQGALIRVEFPDLKGVFGYADIHPWKELGDDALRFQLEKLTKQESTPLLQQCLFLARQEAVAASENRSLYPTGVQLKNNFLISDVVSFDFLELAKIKSQGFDTLKIKCGVDTEKEKLLLLEASHQGFCLRLDFNSVTRAPQVQDFFSNLSDDVIRSIEYVEDPFSFQTEEWKKLNQKICLALDNEWSAYNRVSKSAFDKNNPEFSVLIVKPAKHNVEKVLERWITYGVGITVTSYMDHPLGVLHAWSQALLAKQKFPNLVRQAGCATLDLYEKDEFSEIISVQNAQLVPPVGTGLGLQSILEKVPWRELNSLI